MPPDTFPDRSFCMDHSADDMCETISLGFSGAPSTTGSPLGAKMQKTDRTSTSMDPVASTTRVFRAVRHVHQTAEKFRFEILVEELKLRTPSDTSVNVEWIRGTRKTKTSESRMLPTRNGFCGWSDSEPMTLVATLFRSPVSRDRRKRSGSFSVVNEDGVSGPEDNTNQGPSSIKNFAGRLRRSVTTHTNDLTNLGRSLSPGPTRNSSPRHEATPASSGSPSASRSPSYAPKLAKLQFQDVGMRRLSTASTRVARQNDTKPSPSVLGEVKFCLASLSSAVYPKFQRVTLPLQKCLDPQAQVTFLISCIPTSDDSSTTATLLSTVKRRNSASRSRTMSQLRGTSSVSRSASIRGARSEFLSDDLSSGTSSGLHTGPTTSDVRCRSGGSRKATQAAEVARDTGSNHMFDTPSFGAHSVNSQRPANGINYSLKDALTGTSNDILNFHNNIDAEAVVQQTPLSPIALTDRNESNTRGLLNDSFVPTPSEAMPVLLKRITELEGIVIEKDQLLSSLKDKERSEIQRYENALAAERVVAKTSESHLRNELADRDDKVARLLLQLEEMYEALERAQRQLDLQSVPTENQLKPRGSPSSAPGSTTGSSGESPNRSPGATPQSRASPVDSAFRDEIKLLKRRLRDTEAQSTAYHQALDLETGKRSRMLVDIERKYLQQKKSWSLEKSNLQAQIIDLQDSLQLAENERTNEAHIRTNAEATISGLRLQLANTGASTDYSRTMEATQRELMDMMSARDGMRKTHQVAERKYQRQLNKLSGVAQLQADEIAIERQHFETERGTLKKRILELEQEMSVLPRPSVAQRLNAQLTSAQLASHLEDALVDENGVATQLATTGNADRLSDPMTALGLAARLSELEDELIRTKLALAESETLRDQQLDKTRRRNVVLREQLETYIATVSNLEVQIAESKVKLRGGRTPTGIAGMKSWKVLKRRVISVKDDTGNKDTDSDNGNNAAAPVPRANTMGALQ